jgi:hypothetical protein
MLEVFAIAPERAKADGEDADQDDQPEDIDLREI